MINLKDKNILITGGTSGIGRNLAIQASRIGAHIVIIGRDENKIKSILSEIGEHEHLAYSLDIRQYNNIELIIESAVNKLGKIDGFVHCAGIETTTPLRNMNNLSYETLFATNVISGFEIARILSKKKYCNPKGASYIFMSSVMGKLGEKGKVAYSASKAAILGGVKSMALELASKNIRCNSVLPGLVATEMSNKMFETLPEEAVNAIINKHPLGIGNPEDISNLCLYLLSDLSKWITGSEIVIDGGYSIS